MAPDSRSVVRGSWFAGSDELRWLTIAALSALACAAVSIERTPVDRALPVIAVLLAVCGWMIRDTRWSIGIELAIPLLLASAIVLPDDRTRLMAYGLVVAAAFSIAVYAAQRSLRVYAVLTIVGTLLLRWIPLRDVMIVRELIVMVGALAVLMAIRERTPLAVIAALGVALVTPAIPGKALLFPFVLAAVLAVGQAFLPVLFILFFAAAWFDRYSHAPLWVAAALAAAVPWIARLRLRAPAYAAAVGLFVLWPWSGLVARAFPRFLYGTPGSPRQQVSGLALAAGESVSIDVPNQAHTVTVTASGANTSRMRVGRVVGTIRVGSASRDLRIGDIADFGFLRREQFFNSRNAPPRHPTDDIRGSGQTAWLHGAGRVAVPAGSSVQVSAARDLPAGARLQIESVDFE